MDIKVTTTSTRDLPFPVVDITVNLSPPEQTQFIKITRRATITSNAIFHTLGVTNGDICRCLPREAWEEDSTSDNTSDNMPGNTSDNMPHGLCYGSNILNDLRATIIKENFKWNKASQDIFTRKLIEVINLKWNILTGIHRKFTSEMSTRLGTRDVNILPPQLKATELELRVGEDFYTLLPNPKSRRLKSLVSSIKSELTRNANLDRESLKNALQVQEDSYQQQIRELTQVRSNFIELPRLSHSVIREHKILFTRSDPNVFGLILPFYDQIKKVGRNRRIAILDVPINIKGYMVVKYSPYVNESSSELFVNGIILLTTELKTMDFHPHHSSTLCLGSLNYNDLKIPRITDSYILDTLIPFRDNLQKVLEVVNVDSWFNGIHTSHDLINQLKIEAKRHDQLEPCPLWSKVQNRYWGSRINDRTPSSPPEPEISEEDEGDEVSWNDEDE